MQKIVAMVPLDELDEVMRAVLALRVRCQMSATGVRYADGTVTHRQEYRGVSYETPWETRARLEIVVSSKETESVLGTLAGLLDRDRKKDEAILVSEVDDALRVRTARRGEIAFY
ncbi:MAG TPA: P-II family nitrogen regulator [Myxococcota bacterium]|nr:P-II family nitrogen regulator [Myxococcota bacterium]